MVTGMMSKFICLFCIILISCAGKSNAPSSGVKPILLIDGVNKSNQELNELIAKAQTGDADAALAIAEHCFLAMNDSEQAEYWYKKAAALGGAKEKEIYQSFLESEKEFDENSDN